LAADPDEWMQLALQWDRLAKQAEMLLNWDRPKGERDRWIVVATG
jgi:hypothetical protein